MHPRASGRRRALAGALVAVALAGVDQVQDLIPFIQDLITRFWPGS